MKKKTLFLLPVLALILVSVITINVNSQSVWEKYADNPVLDVGQDGEWDEYGAFVPRVLTHNSTYKYKMYYTGQKADAYQIGYATSSDGINWHKHGSNPVIGSGDYNAWDRNRAADAILDVDGVLKMWYSAWDIDESEYKIGYAWSEDGLNWILNLNPVLEKGAPGEWDEKSVSASSVLFDGTSYHMWYTGTTIDNKTYIGLATSSDGISWMKYPGNPVLTVGESGSFWDVGVHMPAVIYDEGKYKMWFNGDDGTRYRIGYAKSDDGIEWDVFPYPVVNQGDFSQWDRTSLFGHSVIKQGNNYKLWFSGFNMWHWRTGYAEGDEVFNVPDDFASITEALDNLDDGGQILVNPGTYFDNIKLEKKSVSIISNYFFSGDTNDIYNTILDGSQSKDLTVGSTVFFNECPDNEAKLIGFTITGGTGTLSTSNYGAHLGGGILCLNSSATIMHNRIVNNECIAAEYYVCGGGIFAEDSTSKHQLIFQNNVVSGNNIVNSYTGKSFATGGGVSLLTDAIISDNIIENNTVLHSGTGQALGGGLEMYMGTFVVENNQINGNTVENSTATYKPWGGGIFAENMGKGSRIKGNQISDNIMTGSTSHGGGIGIWGNETPLLIDNNIIFNNEAQSGGGVALSYDATIEFTNNYVFNNESTVRGGGIFVRDVSNYGTGMARAEKPGRKVEEVLSEAVLCQLVNNTIVNNHSSGWGGGIYAYYAEDHFLTMNNIIYGNTSVFSGSAVHLNHNANAYLFHNDVNMESVAGPGECIASGNIFVDPELTTDGHLSWTSQCINRGICGIMIGEYCYKSPVVDMDGEQRPYNFTYPDIGADESEVLYVNTPDQADEQLNLEAYPNPFSDFIDIKLKLKGESEVRLVLTNSMGQIVADYTTELMQSGENQFRIEGTKLPAGLYFGEIQVGKQMQAIKLIKIN